MCYGRKNEIIFNALIDEYYSKYIKNGGFLSKFDFKKNLCNSNVLNFLDKNDVSELLKRIKPFNKTFSNQSEPEIKETEDIKRKLKILDPKCTLYNHDTYELETLRGELKKAEKDDIKFNKWIELHKRYKIFYIIGVVLWMTIVFWGPVLLGTLYSLIKEGGEPLPSNISPFLYHLMVGVIWMITFMFTSPVTLPLSFFIGLVIHPILLKKIMFSDSMPYNDNLMEELGHSNQQELNNITGVMTGSVISHLK